VGELKYLIYILAPSPTFAAVGVLDDSYSNRSEVAS
jgi:hypothetical protein